MSARLVYIGGDRELEGLKTMMECRASAPPKGAAPGRRRSSRRWVELPNGDVVSVPRAQLIERAKWAQLFPNAEPATVRQAPSAADHLILTVLRG